MISGLASHPMGSWQPRGDDKSFMWIRDKLPELVPGVRFILYGYDTKLVGSKSFQTVADLANNLINTLKAGGWSSPSSKELAFLAHSLGGVVLKQCFCMLADSDVSSECILQKTKGAIFFGVPSEGMDIEDIHSMLRDQPNKDALVTEISNKSSFLPSLEEHISGIFQLRGMKLFWAYETQETPTVKVLIPNSCYDIHMGREWANIFRSWLTVHMVDRGQGPYWYHGSPPRAIAVLPILRQPYK